MTASVRGRPSGFAVGSSSPTLWQRTTRILQFRRILSLLVRRDLKVRYAGSALGYLWTVLDPLLMSLVYWFIFTKLFTRSIGETPYILFLVSGQLLWAWFNGGVSGTAKALRAEAQMVRSSNVPRELWVLRVVCSKGVEYLFSLPVLALFALAYLKAPNWHIVLLPVACLMMFTLVFAMGLILAPLAVLVRDIDRIIPIFLRVMFYMSPVLYSLGTVLERAPALRYVYSANPAVGPLSLARSAFFPQELRWNFVWHSAVGILILLVLGVYIFRRLEPQVLKEI